MIVVQPAGGRSRRGVSGSSRARGLVAALCSVGLVAGCGLQIAGTEDRIGSRAYLNQVDEAARTGGNRLDGHVCPADAGAAATTSGAVSARQRQDDMDALNLPRWRSADVGVTTPLSDGRVMWVFGDTVRAAGIAPRVVGNSVLISRGRCFQEVRPASGGEVIGGFRTSRACWPSSAITIPMRGADVVVVGCSRVERGKGGLFDFRYRGLTLATFVVTPGGAPQKVTQRDVVADGADPEQINWGAAMTAHDGWVYVYGSQQPKASFGRGAYLARARVAQLNSPQSWQYWDGHGFVSGRARARPFLQASEGVSQSFSVAAWHGRFVLVSKQGGEFGQNIGVWSAPTPYGPWSGRRAVPEPYDQGGGVVAYQPLAHPELATPTGSLLVSLSRTARSFDALLADPVRGRPKFLEVDAS